MPNSASAWRQRPHGRTGPSVSATTAIASKTRSPADTAEKSAVRSAQTVAPKEAFSTLAPAYTRPERARSAAPTAKPE